MRKRNFAKSIPVLIVTVLMASKAHAMIVCPTHDELLYNHAFAGDFSSETPAEIAFWGQVLNYWQMTDEEKSRLELVRFTTAELEIADYGWDTDDQLAELLCFYNTPDDRFVDDREDAVREHAEGTDLQEGVAEVIVSGWIGPPIDTIVEGLTTQLEDDNRWSYHEFAELLEIAGAAPGDDAAGGYYRCRAEGNEVSSCGFPPILRVE